jgi:cytochrome c oxidase assembly protein subunit 15
MSVSGAAGGSGASVWTRWIGAPSSLRTTAIASLAANVGIVVTGGAVRLTGSGLGCPVWPSCADGSLTPVAAQAYHGQIEFANRMLTFVLVAIAVATLAVTTRQRGASDGRGALRWKLALAILVAIAAQAVLGGIAVRTELNPWMVGGHLLLSMVLIALAVVLLHEAPALSAAPVLSAAPALAAVTAGAPARRGPAEGPIAGDLSAGGPSAAEPGVGDPSAAAPVAAIRAALAWLAVLVAGAALILGAVVTGTGPHAGATTAEGVAHRIGIDPRQATQLHADAVMVLVGLSIGLGIIARFAAPSRRWARAVWTLLILEAAQATIGFAQYFAGLPPLLVGVHMLGASLVWTWAIWVLLTGRAGALRRAPSPRRASA